MSVPVGNLWVLIDEFPKRELLVGGLENSVVFPYIGNFIIPTDELHDFSEG